MAVLWNAVIFRLSTSTIYLYRLYSISVSQASIINRIPTSSHLHAMPEWFVGLCVVDWLANHL